LGEEPKPWTIHVRRWLIVIPSIFAVALLVWAVIVVGSGGPNQLVRVGFLIGCCVLYIAAAINYLFFYRLEVDPRSVRRVRWFGLFTQTLPLEAITNIRTRLAWTILFDARALQFCSTTGDIEINADTYQQEPLREALTLLYSTGVPIAPEVLAAYGLQDHGLAAR
jgi:hypothetical protein